MTSEPVAPELAGETTVWLHFSESVGSSPSFDLRVNSTPLNEARNGSVVKELERETPQFTTISGSLAGDETICPNDEEKDSIKVVSSEIAERQNFTISELLTV